MHAEAARLATERRLTLHFSDIVKILEDAGIDGARREAALLAERFCSVDYSSLFPRFADPKLFGSEVEEAARKRASGYPLQYILGEWEFFGLDFYIREGCLIPRSDTEILVEKALSVIPNGARFADACSGSGCIAVSVLKNRPDLSAVAIDLYDTPLSLTKENAERHNILDRLDIERCDVLTEKERLKAILSSCDILLSNPPYITEKAMHELQEEVRHEPESALVGGEDGMDFYRVLLSLAKELCIPAIFEIGYDQGDAMAELAKNLDVSCEIYKDYSENDRVAVCNTVKAN